MSVNAPLRHALLRRAYFPGETVGPVVNWKVDLSDEAIETSIRRHRYRANSLLQLQERRRNRLEQLRQRETSLEHAVQAYAVLDPDAPTTITLRRDFIRLAQPRPPRPDPDEVAPPSRSTQLRADLATRPPLTRLIARDSHALTLYLTALYVAQLQGGTGSRFDNRRHNATLNGTRQSWATLAGLRGPSGGHSAVRNRRLRVTRALAELEKANLVGLGPAGVRDRFTGFTLLRDDGSQRPYTIPAAGPKAVRVPGAFFRNGWHLVLEPAEVAVWLVAAEMSQRLAALLAADGLPGPALALSERHDRYGLSGEAYGAVHELAEFGLLEIVDPMPNRVRGKLRPLTPEQRETAGEAPLQRQPYQLVLTPGGLGRNAYAVVSQALSASDIPPRLA